MSSMQKTFVKAAGWFMAVLICLITSTVLQNRIDRQKDVQWTKVVFVKKNCVDRFYIEMVRSGAKVQWRAYRVGQRFVFRSMNMDLLASVLVVFHEQEWIAVKM